MTGFGILRRIDVSPAFVGFICAYYYFDPLNTFVPFIFSATLHELGHIIALFANRVKIHTINLRLAGIQLKTSTLSYRQEFIVSLAGPLVNLALLYYFRGRDPLLTFMNFCLFTYNILPIYPLDGGRIVNSLLHILLPDRLANLIASSIAALCLLLIVFISCYLTCIWHAGLWPVILSALILFRLGEIFLKEKRKFANYS